MVSVNCDGEPAVALVPPDTLWIPNTNVSSGSVRASSVIVTGTVNVVVLAGTLTGTVVKPPMSAPVPVVPGAADRKTTLNVVATVGLGLLTVIGSENVPLPSVVEPVAGVNRTTVGTGNGGVDELRGTLGFSVAKSLRLLSVSVVPLFWRDLLALIAGTAVAVVSTKPLVTPVP